MRAAKETTRHIQQAEEGKDGEGRQARERGGREGLLCTAEEKRTGIEEGERRGLLLVAPWNVHGERRRHPLARTDPQPVSLR